MTRPSDPQLPTFIDVAVIDNITQVPLSMPIPLSIGTSGSCAYALAATGSAVGGGAVVSRSDSASSASLTGPSKPRQAPHPMSDLDMLAWVTGRSIRNKELRVAFSDDD